MGIAGGLATYLHADYVQSVLEPSVEYHALADAGYFIDAENITGQLHIRALYQYGELKLSVVNCHLLLYLFAHVQYIKCRIAEVGSIKTVFQHKLQMKIGNVSLLR